MAALTSAVPDKVEVLALVEEALAWDLQCPGLRPEVSVSLLLVDRFTAYGKVLADDLGALCLNVRADSKAGYGTQATLGEASRRLHLAAPQPGHHLLEHLRAAGLGALADLGFLGLNDDPDDPVVVTGFKATRARKFTTCEKDANRVLAASRAPASNTASPISRTGAPSPNCAPTPPARPISRAPCSSWRTSKSTADR